jgi:hypothetical protein
MPTGYTAKLHDGEQSFKDFVAHCIEAFMGEGIRSAEAVEKDFNSRLKSTEERLNEIKEELENFEKLTPSEVAAHQKQQHETDALAFKLYCQKKKEVKKRYEAMRDQVLRWQPPGPEHMKFKDWMIKQLEDSIEFDASSKYDDEFAPKLLDPAEYREKKLESMRRYVKFYQDDYDKAVANLEARLKWIRALEESLKNN